MISVIESQFKGIIITLNLILDLHKSNGNNLIYYCSVTIVISTRSEMVEIYTPDLKPYGLTYGQWTVKWWQWMLSIPMEINPAPDESGRNATVNQIDPHVWFLAGTLGGKAVSRKCSIPSRMSILVPIINIEINRLEEPNFKSDDDLIRHVIKDEDDILNLEAVLDGKKIPISRVRSDPPMFPLILSKDNPFGALGDVSTMATSDGYWVFLKPLSPGEHDLFFAGSCSLGTRNVKAAYSLTVI